MILFLIVAALALAAALLVVLNSNPVRSALFLVLNLFCIAGLYLLLNAYFLSAVQVIVYTGAIMVLFLFVIMLLNLGTPDRSPNKLKAQAPVAILGGLLLAGVLVSAVVKGVRPSVPMPSNEAKREGSLLVGMLAEEKPLILPHPLRR
jgi:NADH-quinone oxidoreductase subunit J